MKHVLVISSFVSASLVGGNVSSFCLASHGLTPIFIPTTLLGRHPGWGDPGGGPIDSHVMKSVWHAISRQDLNIEAVLTGYMAHKDHVLLAADIVDQIKSQNPDALIVVDPVMGDEGRLYIEKSIADQIIKQLVPRADIVTPNLFEFSAITGHIPNSSAEAAGFCLNQGGRWLISSLSDEGLSGAVYAGEKDAVRIKHPLLASAPNGSGDALSALFLARLLGGHKPTEAFRYAVSTVYALLEYAQKHGSKELPLIDFGEGLINPALLPLDQL